MDDGRVELSGFHAVKHALRFGAEGVEVWTDDRSRAIDLCERLAPDLVEAFDARLELLESEDFAARAEHTHHTRVIGEAARPAPGPGALDLRAERPVVHLDRPVDPGNVGAVIRVAAAVGAAGVTTTGFDQLWSPACVRGSAGLHFAVPVLDVPSVQRSVDRTVVAFDPDGSVFDPAKVALDSVLMFGSERDGVAPDVLAAADEIVRLPMTAGVSSLNLATSVAASLYALELVGCRSGDHRPGLP